MKAKNHFRRLGTMIDCSRNAVMTVDSVKRWMDLTSDIGYNCVMLYIEDTYEVDDNPYFGHLRGRYSQAELKEIDDYATLKGMELIPCIQTLAHLNAIFHWPAYAQLKDCNDILLSGDERVYTLIDKMFSSLRKCTKCHIVNIGMDEAHMLGRGKYMDIHGNVDRFDILMTHLNKVSEIAKKYDFELIMWGDMFFRILSGGNYYTSEINISDDTKKLIPENVNLIYWDYYSLSQEHYDRQIKLHTEIKDNIWFAGGLWTWSGITPHNIFSIKTMGAAVKSCINYNVQDVFMTLWGDNGSECSKFAMLPSLYAVAENAKGNFDMDNIKEGFEKKYGISFDDFLLLDLPDTANKKNDRANVLNPDKYMLFSDCFMGQMDNKVTIGDGATYGECAKKLAKFTDNKDFGYIFKTQKALCEILEIKFELGIRTRHAYLKNDIDALKELLPDYDEVIKRIDTFYNAFKSQWNIDNKTIGFDVQDLRIGGLIQRIKHCREMLTEYIDKKIPRIEELEQPVLDYNGLGESGDGKHVNHNRWEYIATANIL